MITALDPLNSKEAESYHSWSSNSRWVVFSSRRIDGLYTRPFIANIDENGKASKPFLLPQDDVNYYMQLMKSFNPRVCERQNKDEPLPTITKSA